MVTTILQLTFISTLLSAVIAEAAEQPQEDILKINYVYQLTKFIHWPDINLAQDTPIELCVFSSTSSQNKNSWQKIHLRKSQDREIHLRFINQESQLSQCHILFIDQFSPNTIIENNYYRLTSNNVLTIGERKNFAKGGGIIQLNVTNNEVDIKINIQTASDANININANLIERASSVYSQGQN